MEAILADKTKSPVIELPVIQNYFGMLPKDAGPEKVKKFLLTPQRLSLFKEFFETLHLGQENVKNKDVECGMILSGPNGVGKSFESYLLAATAYVNGCFLLYVPRTHMAAAWDNNNKVASYLLEQFSILNADLAQQFSCSTWMGEGKNLLQLAKAAVVDPMNSLSIFQTFLQELYRVIRVPVVYIIDEHNEIFKNGKESWEVFSAFTISTSHTSGERTFTILSGSAHSKFERNLQPGLGKWLRHIQPFPLESFKQAIAKGGILELPQAWQQSESDIADLYDITGGVPREILFLQSYVNSRTNQLAKDKEEILWNWLGERERTLGAEFYKFLRQHSAEKTEFYQFLEMMFSPQYSSVGPQGSYFFDTGLVFYDQTNECYRPTCLPARRVILTQFYLKYDLPPLKSSEISYPTDFEKRVQRQLMNNISAQTLTAYPLENLKMSLSIVLPAISIEKFMRESTGGIPRNEFKRTCLYRPRTPNFPFWDLVIHEPAADDGVERVIFIQVSINPIRTHDMTTTKKKITKIKWNSNIQDSKCPNPYSLKTNNKTTVPGNKLARSFHRDEKESQSLVEKIVSGITGKPCKSSISAEGELRVEANGVKVKFVYICGTSKSVLELQEKADKFLYPYKNLLVIPREICEKELHLLWDASSPPTASGTPKEAQPQKKRGRPPKEAQPQKKRDRPSKKRIDLKHE